MTMSSKTVDFLEVKHFFFKKKRKKRLKTKNVWKKLPIWKVEYENREKKKEKNTYIPHISHNKAQTVSGSYDQCANDSFDSFILVFSVVNEVVKRI